MAALADVDVVADDAIVDHRARADGDVVADGGWAEDDGCGVNGTVAPNFDQFRALQNLLAFEHGFEQDLELVERIAVDAILEPRAPGKEAEDNISHVDVHPSVDGDQRAQRNVKG